MDVNFEKIVKIPVDWQRGDIGPILLKFILVKENNEMLLQR